MTKEEILQTFSDINHAYNNSTKYDTLKRMLDELTEPCEEHQREFIELVVEYPNPDLCTYPEYRGKPYFSIKYRENGKYIIGYGSYKIEMISQWIKEYFMPRVQPKPIECEDSISRAEALAEIEALKKIHFDRVVVLNKVSDSISALPSIQPKSKTGHWIKSSNGMFAECSDCGKHGEYGLLKQYKYCPNCGAKMECEDKE